jgi:tetratricopeptide (TPR) repeat protein
MRTGLFINLFVAASALLVSSFNASAQVRTSAPSPQVRTSAAASTQHRSITITSEPKATIWIDGVRFGRTNEAGQLEIKTIPPGTHTLKVRAAGFKDASKPIAAAHRGPIAVPLIKTTDPADLAFQEAERLTGEDREKAIEAYERAVKARPSHADAYIGMARMYAEMGEPEQALKAIAGARRARPGFAEASAVEGRIHKDNGEEAKAIAAFKRAITEGKGFQPEAYTGLGLLYKEKAEGFSMSGDYDQEAANYAEAAKNLKVAIKQLSGAPDTIVLYQLLGLVYERQKNYKEAIATYEEFLRLFPDSNEAEAVRSFIVQLKKDMASQE